MTRTNLIDTHIQTQATTIPKGQSWPLAKISIYVKSAHNGPNVADSMQALIFHTTFSNPFSCMEIIVFWEFGSTDEIFKMVVMVYTQNHASTFHQPKLK